MLVTRRGVPVAEIVAPSAASLGQSWLGSMRGTATVTGDLVEPVVAPEEGEALTR